MSKKTTILVIGAVVVSALVIALTLALRPKPAREPKVSGTVDPGDTAPATGSAHPGGQPPGSPPGAGSGSATSPPGAGSATAPGSGTATASPPNSPPDIGMIPRDDAGNFILPPKTERDSWENPPNQVSQDLTRRSLAAIVPEARRCVEQGRVTDPSLTASKLQLTYTLVVENGKAKVLTPFIADSDITDPAIRDCIINTAATAVIDAAGEPEGKRTRVKDTIIFPSPTRPNLPPQ